MPEARNPPCQFDLHMACQHYNVSKNMLALRAKGSSNKTEIINVKDDGTPKLPACLLKKKIYPFVVEIILLIFQQSSPN
jgi:hypothetical protein